MRRLQLEDVLNTVDTVLSSPPLPPSILDACKIFLFITASSPPAMSGKRRRLDKTIDGSRKDMRERVVSVVVAQGIKWALRVLRPADERGGREEAIDSGGGVLCEYVFPPFPLRRRC